MKHTCKSLFLVVFLTAGCAHVDTPETGPSRQVEDYYPLAVGNCWTYTASFQGQQQPDLKVCIVKQERKYFIDDRQSPSRLRFDAEGLRDGSVRYLLKSPLETGQKWMSVVDVHKVEHYQIEAVDKRVKVPAGTFQNCVVVRMEEKMTSKRSLIARNCSLGIEERASMISPLSIGFPTRRNKTGARARGVILPEE